MSTVTNHLRGEPSLLATPRPQPLLPFCRNPPLKAVCASGLQPVLPHTRSVPSTPLHRNCDLIRATLPGPAAPGRPSCCLHSSPPPSSPPLLPERTPPPRPASTLPARVLLGFLARAWPGPCRSLLISRTLSSGPLRTRALGLLAGLSTLPPSRAAQACGLNEQLMPLSVCLQPRLLLGAPSGRPALEASRRPASPHPTVAGPSRHILRSHPPSGLAREPSGPPFRTFPEPAQSLHLTPYWLGWCDGLPFGPPVSRPDPTAEAPAAAGFCVAKAEHALQPLSSSPGQRPEP